MNETVKESRPPRAKENIARLALLLLGIPITMGQLILSRRGFSLGFLGLCAVLATSGWVRPPLSHDLKGLHVSLGLLQHGSMLDQVTGDTRRIPADSIGVIFLVVIAAAAVVVALKPKSLGLTAGLLMCLTIVANAAVALNSPVMMEWLDAQIHQRTQISEILDQTLIDVLSDSGATRVDEATPNNAQIGLLRGWDYLLYGKLLGIVAAVGLLLASPGPLGRRFTRLFIWTVLGVGLTALLCFPRLQGAYYMAQAERLHRQADTYGARRALGIAISTFPQLGMLEHTWSLRGRIDFIEGRNTEAARSFQAEQLAQKREWDSCLKLLQLPLADKVDHPAMWRQAGRVLASFGLSEYEEGRLGAAREAWRQALGVDPHRFDCPLFLAMVQARMDRSHPHLVEAMMIPLVKRIADRRIKADAIAILGDAYFEAADIAQARRYYRQSLRYYELPKLVNYRARRGLVGF